MFLIFCEWVAGFEGQPDGHVRERLQLLGLRQALVQKPSFPFFCLLPERLPRARGRVLLDREVRNLECLESKNSTPRPSGGHVSRPPGALANWDA